LGKVVAVAMSGNELNAVRVKVHLRCLDCGTTPGDQYQHRSFDLVQQGRVLETKHLVLLDVAELKTGKG
jgi:hypothetical protein